MSKSTACVNRDGTNCTCQAVFGSTDYCPLRERKPTTLDRVLRALRTIIRGEG